MDAHASTLDKSFSVKIPWEYCSCPPNSQKAEEKSSTTNKDINTKSRIMKLFGIHSIGIAAKELPKESANNIENEYVPQPTLDATFSEENALHASYSPSSCENPFAASPGSSKNQEEEYVPQPLRIATCSGKSYDYIEYSPSSAVHPSKRKNNIFGENSVSSCRRSKRIKDRDDALTSELSSTDSSGVFGLSLNYKDTCKKKCDCCKPANNVENMKSKLLDYSQSPVKDVPKNELATGGRKKSSESISNRKTVPTKEVTGTSKMNIKEPEKICSNVEKLDFTNTKKEKQDNATEGKKNAKNIPSKAIKKKNLDLGYNADKLEFKEKTKKKQTNVTKRRKISAVKMESDKTVSQLHGDSLDFQCEDLSKPIKNVKRKKIVFQHGRQKCIPTSTPKSQSHPFKGSKMRKAQRIVIETEKLIAEGMKFLEESMSFGDSESLAQGPISCEEGSDGKYSTKEKDIDCSASEKKKAGECSISKKKKNGECSTSKKKKDGDCYISEKKNCKPVTIKKERDDKCSTSEEKKYSKCPTKKKKQKSECSQEKKVRRKTSKKLPSNQQTLEDCFLINSLLTDTETKQYPDVTKRSKDKLRHNSSDGDLFLDSNPTEVSEQNTDSSEFKVDDSYEFKRGESSSSRSTMLLKDQSQEWDFDGPTSTSDNENKIENKRDSHFELMDNDSTEKSDVTSSFQESNREVIAGSSGIEPSQQSCIGEDISKDSSCLITGEEKNSLSIEELQQIYQKIVNTTEKELRDRLEESDKFLCDIIQGRQQNERHEMFKKNYCRNYFSELVYGPFSEEQIEFVTQYLKDNYVELLMQTKWDLHYSRTYVWKVLGPSFLIKLIMDNQNCSDIVSEQILYDISMKVLQTKW